MKSFGYVRDPLCLLTMALYALNRWALKPQLTGGGFMHDHFNDLLLIPAALPLILWVQRKLGWRDHDQAPRWSEIGLHLAIWGVICEIAGPSIAAHATGDWRDLVAYTVGAAVAGLWWQRRSLPRRARVPSELKADS
ncbi:hypothetical protein [Actomonas aquatica]|uniref:VanZ-like domain-containing protein n=1 Tax=Actomonas aquatica TaxID=2866162 RepID=A0ABZ1C6K9_9BACT|nr:hypothetical protein [Opitutus sp. WL0086]WRQ87229.1 hypothetical protein K1X11_020645 [Opitutus sp. WL0086]